MQLRITDGTTTSTLISSGSHSAITYFPQPPDEGAEEVAETVELLLEATPANLVAAAQQIERLFEAARLRQELNAGPRVYAEYQSLDGGDYYRSEIFDGRLVWGPQPAARRLTGSDSRKATMALHWRRRYFWEGPETAVALSSSVTGTPQTTAIDFYSNDDATVGQTNWLNIASTVIGGSLPTPLKIEIANGEASGLNVRQVIISNNAHADPAGMDPFALGTEANGVPPNPSWGAAVGHTTDQFIWDFSSARWEDFGGRYWRVLFVPGGFTAGIYVKPWVKWLVGGFYTAIWEGDETLLEGNDEIFDLGAVPLPPGGYNTSMTSVSLTLSVRSSGAGSIDLDFLMLCLAGKGMFRRLRMPAFALATTEALVDDGIEGIAYVADESTGLSREPALTAFGLPIHVWPGKVNRLRVLVQETNWTPGRLFQAQAWYRPRVLTV